MRLNKWYELQTPCMRPHHNTFRTSQNPGLASATALAFSDDVTATTRPSLLIEATTSANALQQHTELRLMLSSACIDIGLDSLEVLGRGAQDLVPALLPLLVGHSQQVAAEGRGPLGVRKLIRVNVAHRADDGLRKGGIAILAEVVGRGMAKTVVRGRCAKLLSRFADARRLVSLQTLPPLVPW